MGEHLPARIILLVACGSMLLFGCERKTSDKYSVFCQYFHTGAPTNATVIFGTNWEAGDGPLLDESALILDAELPHDFLDAELPLTASATPNLKTIESLFGDVDLNRGVAQALKDSPSWFKPDDLS